MFPGLFVIGEGIGVQMVRLVEGVREEAVEREGFILGIFWMDFFWEGLS
jgi:hypothetical protein